LDAVIENDYELALEITPGIRMHPKLPMTTAMSLLSFSVTEPCFGRGNTKEDEKGGWEVELHYFKA
jgi:hypothetical protein